VSKALKNDKNKPRLSLIPVEALNHMAKAFGFGADKYGRFNYRKGMEHSRLLDAALRHINAITSGEEYDPESKLHHVGHALASLAMYAYNIEHHKKLNDLKE
jgi:hypothetical protein